MHNQPVLYHFEKESPFLGPIHMKLAIFDPPVATGLVVVVTELRALEVVSEGRANTGIALGGAGCTQQAGGSASPMGAARRTAPPSPR